MNQWPCIVIHSIALSDKSGKAYHFLVTHLKHYWMWLQKNPEQLGEIFRFLCTYVGVHYPDGSETWYGWHFRGVKIGVWNYTNEPPGNQEVCVFNQKEVCVFDQKGKITYSETLFNNGMKLFSHWNKGGLKHGKHRSYFQPYTVDLEGHATSSRLKERLSTIYDINILNHVLFEGEYDCGIPVGKWVFWKYGRDYIDGEIVYKDRKGHRREYTIFYPPEEDGAIRSVREMWEEEEGWAIQVVCGCGPRLLVPQ